MVKVHLFLLCYNEELMLPHTIKYYRSRFSEVEIIILDNYSTDNSCKIAEKLGCRVHKYDSNNQMDEQYLVWVRSHLWKQFVTEGWVIMCDMDEWLDITEEELINEDTNGTTIILTKGVNMVGEAKTQDFSDINLFDIKRGFFDDNFSKKICIKYPLVNDIQYWYGAHQCFPQGQVVYSEKPYYLRHYNYIGAEYLVEKHRLRYDRNEKSRSRCLNTHYLNEREAVIKLYNDVLEKATII